MDIQRYDPKTIALIEKVFEQKNSMSEGVFRTLSRLRKVARETGDYTLQGFVHFHLADTIYSYEKDYNEFRQHLARSVYYFQLGGEKELLARAYNYVAVDALNNSSYDVAYLYLMNALHACEGLDNDYLLCIINNNIGQVYARMSNYKKALKYVRLGNKLQARTHKDDFYYHQNMINGYFSEGVLCCLLGDLPGAERADRNIGKIEKECDMSHITSVFIPISLLRLMIAVLREDVALTEFHSKQFVEKMHSAHRLYDYITDISDLCHFLIEQNYLATVRMILDMIKEEVDSSGVVQMKRILSSIEIAYYEKRGDEKALMAHLHEQYQLSEQQQMEQNRVYQYSVDLIDIMEEQRKEQEKVRLENEHLQSQVQTDPLTGIPNRLVLDSSLPLLYARTRKAGQSFGVSMIDINKFKEFNDTYGHLAGDFCLQQVAKTIQDVANRPGVSCARYGGDEFIMLYENKTDEEIRSIAEELNEKIHALDIAHSGMGKSGRVSLSQGICNGIPKRGHKKEEYLNEADNALYAVKKNLDIPGREESIRLVHLPS